MLEPFLQAPPLQYLWATLLKNWKRSRNPYGDFEIGMNPTNRRMAMKKRNSVDSNTGKKKVVGFQVIENECIWMKAGVVNFHLCDNAYDCFTCPFDHAMRRAMAGGEISNKDKASSWNAELSRKSGRERPCPSAQQLRSYFRRPRGEMLSARSD